MNKLTETEAAEKEPCDNAGNPAFNPAELIDRITFPGDSDSGYKITMRDIEGISENKIQEAKGLFLYCMETDPESGSLRICPFDGNHCIEIRNKKEAEFFTKIILDHFQNE